MHFKKIEIKNRFTALLLSLVFLFVVSPYLSKFNFPALSSLLFLVVIFTLRALKIKRLLFAACTALACLGILSETLILFEHVSPQNLILPVLTQSFYILFVIFSTGLLVIRVFSEKSITADTIGGGISIYLLTGLLWSFFFQLINTIDSHAFIVNSADNKIKDLFLYFSFNTITTMGFGDISPTNQLAMVLASLEALWGQIYLTVFIARLVGLHIAPKSKD